jgi:hypothetical protein
MNRNDSAFSVHLIRKYAEIGLVAQDIRKISFTALIFSIFIASTHSSEYSVSISLHP